MTDSRDWGSTYVVQNMGAMLYGIYSNGPTSMKVHNTATGMRTMSSQLTDLEAAKLCYVRGYFTLHELEEAVERIVKLESECDEYFVQDMIYNIEHNAEE